MKGSADHLWRSGATPAELAAIGDLDRQISEVDEFRRSLARERYVILSRACARAGRRRKQDMRKVL